MIGKILYAVILLALGVIIFFITYRTGQKVLEVGDEHNSWLRRSDIAEGIGDRLFWLVTLAVLWASIISLKTDVTLQTEIDILEKRIEVLEQQATDTTSTYIINEETIKTE